MIPNWPAHYCYDWDNMEEHIRYSVYFRAGYEQEVLQSRGGAAKFGLISITYHKYILGVYKYILRLEISIFDRKNR